LRAELNCDSEEDVFCEWEAISVGVLTVDSFSPFEDSGDDGVLEFEAMSRHPLKKEKRRKKEKARKYNNT
jgi:hypothetical protein